MSGGRLPGIDALRMIGAVLVVGLHVGTFAEWPDALMQISRASGRWVVPFFFLVMGYFIGLQRVGGYETAALKSARRVLSIIVVSTVIFLLLRLALNGPRQTLLTLVSPEFFVRGIWGHQWFLHASLAGLLLLALKPQVTGRTAALSAALLLLCGALDTLFAAQKIDWGTMFANRFAAGVCLFLLGVWTAQRPLWRLSSAAGLFVAGVAVLLAQGLLARRFGAEPSELQLQPGAMLMAVALVYIGLALPSRPSLERLADWGRRYALGLYLLHPLFIEVLRRAGIARSDLLWLCATLGSLLALAAAEQFFPSAKAKLDGR